MNENDVMIEKNEEVCEDKTSQKPSKAFVGSLIGVVSTVAVGAVIGIRHYIKKKSIDDELLDEAVLDETYENEDEDNQETEISTESEEVENE